MNKILLHSCCAPCSAAIIEKLLQEGSEVVLFYYNPNIYPAEEYLVRKRELTAYARKLGVLVIEGDYNHADFLACAKGLEAEPERGGRCFQCFKMRMMRSAELAKRLGISVFSTTLSSSRWKSYPQIYKAGCEAAEKYGVTFLDRDWKKHGLTERRAQLLRSEGFYNQQYCGCEFSIRK